MPLGNFDTLPKDMTKLIMEELDPESLGKVAQTSKDFNALIKNDDFQWDLEGRFPRTIGIRGLIRRSKEVGGGTDIKAMDRCLRDMQLEDMVLSSELQKGGLGTEAPEVARHLPNLNAAARGLAVRIKTLSSGTGGNG